MTMDSRELLMRSALKGIRSFGQGVVGVSTTHSKWTWTGTTRRRRRTKYINSRSITSKLVMRAMTAADLGGAVATDRGPVDGAIAISRNCFTARESSLPLRL